MVLCFAALVKVLKFCAKPKVTNKALCGAVIKTIDEYYGNIMEADDSKVSRLLSCTDNLSPADVIDPARSTKPVKVSAGMTKYVLPLLDPERLPLAMLALQDIALTSISEDASKIGRISRDDLMLMISFNPAEFLTDVLLYAATEVENKTGSGTIAAVTKEYVDGFEAYRDNIRIESTVIVETEELECTLKDSDFGAVFREVDHSEALGLKNKSGISLYYLDISASAFDYMALNDYLFDSVGMYVYSRTQIQDFCDKKKVRSIGAKALRLMKANGRPDQKGTGNELGEMLLFAFMEEGLHAPKLLISVSLFSFGCRAILVLFQSLRIKIAEGCIPVTFANDMRKAQRSIHRSTFGLLCCLLRVVCKRLQHLLCSLRKEFWVTRDDSEIAEAERHEGQHCEPCAVGAGEGKLRRDAAA